MLQGCWCVSPLDECGCGRPPPPRLLQPSRRARLFLTTASNPLSRVYLSLALACLISAQRWMHRARVGVLSLNRAKATKARHANARCRLTAHPARVTRPTLELPVVDFVPAQPPTLHRDTTNPPLIDCLNSPQNPDIFCIYSKCMPPGLHGKFISAATILPLQILSPSTFSVLWNRPGQFHSGSSTPRDAVRTRHDQPPSSSLTTA